MRFAASFGIGDVQMLGQDLCVIRIWMQPDKLAQLGLTPADVTAWPCASRTRPMYALKLGTVREESGLHRE